MAPRSPRRVELYHVRKKNHLRAFSVSHNKETSMNGKADLIDSSLTTAWKGWSWLIVEMAAWSSAKITAHLCRRQGDERHSSLRNFAFESGNVSFGMGYSVFATNVRFFRFSWFIPKNPLSPSRACIAQNCQKYFYYSWKKMVGFLFYFDGLGWIDSFFYNNKARSLLSHNLVFTLTT